MIEQSLESKEPKAKKPAPISDAEMRRIASTTKAHLDAQPRVRIRLPKSQNPKDPNFETVQINGYTIMIMRGVDVEVASEVAEILYRAGY